MLCRIGLRLRGARSRSRLGHTPVPSHETWHDVDAQHGEPAAAVQQQHACMEMEMEMHGPLHAEERAALKRHGHASSSGPGGASTSSMQWHAPARIRPGSCSTEQSSSMDVAGGMLPVSAMPSSPKAGAK